MTAPATGRGARLWAWLDDRLGMSALQPFIKKKRVPVHRHSIWYFLGGMVLFLFVLQVCTGVLMLFYYRPSANEAFDSVQFMMTQVKFGWLVRSIHVWGANLMIFVLFIHLFSVWVLKAYRAPREFTWFTGLALLGLTLGLGFTGYLLPWNTLSYFATRVGTSMATVIPGIGPFVGRVLRSGNDVTGATLTRFYALHTSVLPGLVFLFLGLHVLLVQKHGMSLPPGVERDAKKVRSVPFVPNFLLHDLIGWLIALGTIAALAVFLPAELGKKADMFASAPAGIKPEWYFMAPYQTLKYIPATVFHIPGDALGIVVGGVLGVAFALMPFLDRARPDGTYRPVWRIVAFATLTYLVVFTYLGLAS
ncbi:MAG: cytochrome bc complex cytochrome b subunit [Gemmatimonadota bacterium]|nr:cytochrome bc complex cytochrome b subunit [Gemmatimonadota bacterium]MDE3171692.1 cytochrome bc complex cytochrome b subunit [Gemmatimonadota bacterium]MDE3217489.1 cytochrome bc complex cytochrome b subunit [Gemmatimonadota bacterium]